MLCYMKKLQNLFIYSLLAICLLAGCKGTNERHNDGDITIERFEQTLFDTPADQLQQALRDFKTKFNSPLLNIYPDDQLYMSQLADFMSDSTVRDIYRISDRQYHSLHWLEKELTVALDKAKSLDDEIDYKWFATFISGNFDYAQRIIAARETKSVLINIDQYALGGMEKYSYFGLPMYIVEMSDSTYLASDIMAEIARQFIEVPDEQNITMLDLMISEGKVLYFLDQVMPKKDNRLKIRYSEEQMEWMKANESNVWAFFIQNNLLYEKDFSRYHNFVDDAPKTVSRLSGIGGPCGMSTMKYGMLDSAYIAAVKAAGFDVQASIFPSPHEQRAVLDGVTIQLSDFWWHQTDGRKPLSIFKKNSVKLAEGQSVEWNPEAPEFAAVTIALDFEGTLEVTLNGRVYTLTHDGPGKVEVLGARLFKANPGIVVKALAASKIKSIKAELFDCGK